MMQSEYTMHCYLSFKKRLLRWSVMPNSALLTDAFSLLRCACGAVKRGR